jgi:hypothetical protein
MFGAQVDLYAGAWAGGPQIALGIARVGLRLEDDYLPSLVAQSQHNGAQKGSVADADDKLRSGEGGQLDQPAQLVRSLDLVPQLAVSARRRPQVTQVRPHVARKASRRTPPPEA